MSREKEERRVVCRRRAVANIEQQTTTNTAQKVEKGNPDDHSVIVRYVR